MLTFDELSAAVRSSAAIRVTTKLQPTGGPGEKVFPPTYGAKKGEDGACYSFENRVLPGGEIVECHLLDSVQSQANRFEEALDAALDEGRLQLPRLVLDFAGTDHADLGRLSSLQAEWSTTLAPLDWTNIPDTGTAPQHVFSVPIGSNTRLFIRLSTQRNGDKGMNSITKAFIPLSPFLCVISESKTDFLRWCQGQFQAPDT